MLFNTYSSLAFDMALTSDSKDVEKSKKVDEGSFHE
jgi:hypothetical protein